MKIHSLPFSSTLYFFHNTVTIFMLHILANSSHYHCTVHGTLINELQAYTRAHCSVPLLSMNTILWKSRTFSCLSKEKRKLWIETIPSRAFRLAVGTDFQPMWMMGVPPAQGSSGAGLIYTNGRFSSAYAPFSIKCMCSKLAPAQSESGNKTDHCKIQGTSQGTISAEALGEVLLVHLRSEDGPLQLQLA